MDNIQAILGVHFLVAGKAFTFEGAGQIYAKSAVTAAAQLFPCISIPLAFVYVIANCAVAEKPLFASTHRCVFSRLANGIL